MPPGPVQPCFDPGSESNAGKLRLLEEEARRAARKVLLHLFTLGGVFWRGPQIQGMPLSNQVAHQQGRCSETNGGLGRRFALASGGGFAPSPRPGRFFARACKEGPGAANPARGNGPPWPQPRNRPRTQPGCTVAKPALAVSLQPKPNQLLAEPHCTKDRTCGRVCQTAIKRFRGKDADDTRLYAARQIRTIPTLNYGFLRHIPNSS